jgi:hypothetical protein
MADGSGRQTGEGPRQDVEAQAFSQKFNISPDLAKRLFDLYWKQRAKHEVKRTK